jgi:hypothetical protein
MSKTQQMNSEDRLKRWSAVVWLLPCVEDRTDDPPVDWRAVWPDEPFEKIAQNVTQHIFLSKLHNVPMY